MKCSGGRRKKSGHLRIATNQREHILNSCAPGAWNFIACLSLLEVSIAIAIGTPTPMFGLCSIKSSGKLSSEIPLHGSEQATVKGNFGQGSKLWGPNTDTIHFYAKTSDHTFNPQFNSYSYEYIERFYKFREQDGRRYRLISMIGPGGGAKGNPHYECMGVTRFWRYSRETMGKLIADGMVVQTKPGTVPQRKLYLDKGKGVAIQSLWEDIESLSPSAKERLGYPTQKPLALLDRIIKASTNPGDLVLDGFCGCGTALVSAQNLGRRWIGIDVSPTACRVMAKRLEDSCKLRERKDFFVRDMPHSVDFLRKIPPFEFENWAVVALGGIPNSAKVGDMGIDGRIYPVSAVPQKQKDKLNFMDHWYPIQVKQAKVGRPYIDQFEAVMMREDRTKGFFVAFNYTSDAKTEINAFFKRTGKAIIALTVDEILEEEIAMKLA